MPIAFEEYAASRFVALRRLAFLLTGDWHAAEDVVQEALLRCERRWRRIAGDDPHPYVRRAIVNGSSSWRRRRRVDLPLDEQLSTADGTAGVDLRVVLVEALRRLPVEQRQVLVLRYFERLSEAETAALLGVPAGTVKSRVSRGLQALRAAGLDAPTTTGASA